MDQPWHCSTSVLPGLRVGAAAAHAGLEVGRADRPSDTGALLACRCRGQGEHLPLVKTLEPLLTHSVISIGLLFILVSCDDYYLKTFANKTA